jgi:flavin-dependent dehydrogenase
MMTADFSSRPDFPVVTIDKPAFLRLLAEQAAAAGATLHFGSAVTGLLEEGGAIAGIETRSEAVRARVVLTCEGVSRQFSQMAGFYGQVQADAGYAFVVAESLDAPEAGPSDVGQLSTLGQRYLGVPRAFGTVVIPAPGKAEVYFSVFADDPVICTGRSLWHYLECYKQDDPRIRRLFVGARSRHRSGCRMVLRKVPSTVVRDGLIAVGDSVGPGGHVGILPCVFLGQAAAQTAMQAIQSGDVSARRLASYERLFHGRFLRGLETEGRIVTSLTHMTDDEIDRVCQTFGRINLAPFFFGQTGPILRTAVQWIATSLPLIVRDWTLIRRMLK